MGKKKYDFSGWATRNDLRCSDGRTIRKDAFKINDGQIVPLVWQHQHNSPDNVLGHALLENREEGVYMYGSFNDTPKAQHAKALVEHGDVSSLSIYANKLQQKGGDVLHGVIREVSLVLSGANPGAYIEFPVLEHSGEEIEDEALIYTGEEISLCHEDSMEEAKEDSKPEASIKEEKKEMAEKTVKDVFDELTEEQKKVVYFMIGQALEDAKNEGGTASKDEAKHSAYDDGGDMRYNVFDGDNYEENTLSHADMETIIKDGKKYGSLKESFLAHAEEYGIENIEYLFPDAKAMTNAPDFIKRQDEWVDKFLNGTHHTPFSRIKSVHADITEDEARAKGYIKGKLKKEEVFSLLKRVTTPTTIYKKQKLDRDDVVDITDFDVVSWLKTEMRMMLNEEIARAALISDGRSSSSDDKINELNIRPIYTDDDLYTIKVTVPVAAAATDDDKAKAFIKAALKARKNFRGSGSPILFTTEDMLSSMLLLTDEVGRDLYENKEKLAQKLRVRDIVTVEPMEGVTRSVDGVTHTLAAIVVNPADYNIGADKGGAINMFDDFDIDYNQQKYLIETRCSGALTKPFSAMAIEFTPAE